MKNKKTKTFSIEGTTIDQMVKALADAGFAEAKKHTNLTDSEKIGLLIAGSHRFSKLLQEKAETEFGMEMVGEVKR